MRMITIAIVVGLIAVAAWQYRDTSVMRSVLGPIELSLKKIKPENNATRVDASGKPMGKSASERREAAGMRKCQSKSEVTYTNGKCPAGSQEIEMSGGTVTVLPVEASPPAASEAKPAAPVQSPLERLAPENVDIKGKRVQQAGG